MSRRTLVQSGGAVGAGVEGPSFAGYRGGRALPPRPGGWPASDLLVPVGGAARQSDGWVRLPVPDALPDRRPRAPRVAGRADRRALRGGVLRGGDGGRAAGGPDRPAANATVADLVPPADRPRAFNLYYWAVNLGFSIASVLAGVMADVSYFWLFAGDAATTFACGLLMWRKVPETQPHRASGSGERAPPAQPGDLLAPFRDGVYAAFVLTSFVTYLLFFQSNLGMPVDMQAHGLSAKTFGAVIAVNGVMIVLLQPFASRITGGRPRSL